VLGPLVAGPGRASWLKGKMISFFFLSIFHQILMTFSEYMNFTIQFLGDQALYATSKSF
jgi:hypothetical protein